MCHKKLKEAVFVNISQTVKDFKIRSVAINGLKKMISGHFNQFFLSGLKILLTIKDNQYGTFYTYKVSDKIKLSFHLFYNIFDIPQLSWSVKTDSLNGCHILILYN